MCKGCKHNNFATICTLCKDFALYEVENMQELTNEEHDELHGTKNIELDNAQREFADEIKSRTGYTIHFTESEVDALIDSLNENAEIQRDSGNVLYELELIKLSEKLNQP